MDASIDTRVRLVIAAELGLGTYEIASDAILDRDLGADSHDRQSLTLALEDEFAIEIPDHDGAQLHTVRQIVAYVTARAGNAAAG